VNSPRYNGTQSACADIDRRSPATAPFPPRLTPRPPEDVTPALPHSRTPALPHSRTFRLDAPSVYA